MGCVSSSPVYLVTYSKLTVGEENNFEKEYAEKALQIAKKYGAKVIAFGQAETFFNKNVNFEPDVVAVISFPSEKKYMKFKNSETYAALHTVRDRTVLRSNWQVVHG